jgi:hypothetical protein
LRPIVTLGELVIDLPRPSLLGLKALSLDVAVNPIELIDKGVELLQMLTEGGLTGEDRGSTPSVGTSTLLSS